MIDKLSAEDPQVETQEAEMVVVRMKVGEDRRFDETYNERVRVKYEGVFAVITDKDGVRYSFPAVDIAEIKQDAGSRSW